MATVASVVKRAFRLLGLTQSGEEPTAAEASDAVQALNEMLHGWALEGVDLEHSDVAYSDTFPYQEEYREPIAYNLAVLLADEYGKDVPQIVFTKAADGFSRILHSIGGPVEPNYDHPTDDPRINTNWHTY